MKTTGASMTTRDLRSLFEVGGLGGLPDGELLDRFVAGRDAVALEVLVKRHGSMVWAVCLRVLGDHHDAEDAFQATFLVFARKARSVTPRAMVGNWLHGVAYRTAIKARAIRSKKRGREVRSHELTDPSEARSGPLDDLLPRLDEELARLPEKYKAPLILCEVEGMAHRDAADRLGWPVGTVSGRLSRARVILARRLARSEVASSGGTLGLMLANSGATIGVPASLVSPTVKAACLSAAGRAATSGLISIETAAITKGILRTMLFTKFKVVASILLSVGLMGFAAEAVAQRGSGASIGSKPTSGDSIAKPRAERPVAKAEPVDPTPVAVDPALSKAVEGRIVQASIVSKDIMVLSYLPDWAYGNLDNIGLSNEDGGARTIVAWPKIPAEQTGLPNRRFLLAFYSRQTVAAAKVGPILAFEVDDDWGERTSWKTQPDYAVEPAATFPFQPGEGWKLFDVTPLVRARLKNDRVDRGIVLRFLSEDLRGKGKGSGYQMVSREGEGEWLARRPQLLVVEPSKK